MNFSDVILSRLATTGVTKVFGIPGDYVLPFFDHLVDPNQPVEHVGTANELNAVYAADGYSRLKGFGAAAVTYGPGALNAVNAIAGAYNENVPLLFIAGAPNTTVDTTNKLYHHVVKNDIDKTVNIFKPITADAVRLTSVNDAVEELDRLIQLSLDTKLPVYIEVPYDIQIAEVTEIPEFHYLAPITDSELLESTGKTILKAIKNAQNPAVLLGDFVDRYLAQNKVYTLLKKTHLPFASTFDAKAGYAESLPNCVGFYQGAMSVDSVKKIIEGADLLLNLGAPLTEFNTGMFTDHLDPAKSIQIMNNYVVIKGKKIEHVYFNDLLQFLFQRKEEIIQDAVNYDDTFAFSYNHQLKVEKGRKITVDNMYLQLAHHFEEGDIVAGDTGGYINLTRLRLPKNTITLGNGNWGSLGQGFANAIGMAFANEDQQRMICLEGDGSFHMTGQEFQTLVKNKKDMTLIILNNEGYTAERAIQPDAYDPYNDIQVWQYHKMTEFFGGNKSENGVEVTTEDEFAHALKLSNSRRGPFVINVRLDKLDVASFNSAMSQAMKH